MDWVLTIFGTQVIKKNRPGRPVFPDYLSVSYDYDASKKVVHKAGEYLGNKIADAVTKSIDDNNEKKELVEEIIIPQEKEKKY